MLDLAENLATWIALGNNDRRFTYPENLAAPTVISTLAWLKMLAYGAGLLCVAAGLPARLRPAQGVGDADPAAPTAPSP